MIEVSQPHGPPGERRRFALVASGLVALCALAFAPRILDLGLLHDDWFYFHEVANGSAPVSSPGGLRPLHGLIWRACGALFGPALPGYYAVLFALQWLAAALLYLLARRYASPTFAAAFAALALVYPADASHLWLSSMPQRTAWLLALGAIACGERARDGGTSRTSDGWMLPALALGFFSLAVYELHFFLLALWPAAAALLGAPWRRRQLLAWSAVPALYLAWRFAWRPAAGGPTVVNTELLWDPVEIARRGAVLVPYNLFADGWWIGLREAVSGSPLAAGAVFVAAAAFVRLAPRLGADRAATGRPDWRRGLAVAALLAVLGAAPVVPTTYWLGRTAGTFGSRILACALPGAALLLLLALAGIVRRPAARAIAAAAALTLACAFHWNVARLAADNWAVQQRLADALRDAVDPAGRHPWPAGSFLVLLDLPPNRLGYDTPWGMGRMIQKTTGDPTLSGIGISGDRQPGEILSLRKGDILIHGGAFATTPLERTVFLRWQAGRLVEAESPELPGTR